jgi:hypothetical protein
MSINPEFELLEIVYLKTDIQQLPRIITAYRVSPNGIMYLLSQGAHSDYFYAGEMTKEKDVILSFS